jgi:hypothetical protein
LGVVLTAGENADASRELKKTLKLKREMIAVIDFVNILAFFFLIAIAQSNCNDDVLEKDP